MEPPWVTCFGFCSNECNDFPVFLIEEEKDRDSKALESQVCNSLNRHRRPDYHFEVCWPVKILAYLSSHVVPRKSTTIDTQRQFMRERWGGVLLGSLNFRFRSTRAW